MTRTANRAATPIAIIATLRSVEMPVAPFRLVSGSADDVYGTGEGAPGRVTG